VEEKIHLPFAEYNSFQISPDGKRLSITIKDPDAWNIGIYDFKSRTRTTLTLDGNNKDPVWTPDGKWVTFNSNRDGYPRLYKKRVDGREDLEPLTKKMDHSEYIRASDWSPDGNILAIEDWNQQNTDILMLDNSGTIQPFVKTRFNEWGPVFSPDGKWVAYTSNEQGKYNVYVQPYPQTGEKWPVSSEGGQEPIWSQKTKEIYFWTYDKNVVQWMVASYTDTPIFSCETPREFLKRHYLNVGGRGWDISPIDQRFLLLKGGDEYNKKYTQLNVVANWFEELKEKMAMAGGR
jgi:Tol biopolymer transport system component